MNRTAKILLIATLGASLVACCTQVAKPPEIVDTSCQRYQLIMLEPVDAHLVQTKQLSSSLVNQILAHNRTWERRCGGRPETPREKDGEATPPHDEAEKPP